MRQLSSLRIWPSVLHGTEPEEVIRALLMDSEEEDIVPKDSELRLQKLKHLVSSVLEVVSVPFQYTKAVRTYGKDPGVRKAQHTSVCE